MCFSPIDNLQVSSPNSNRQNPVANPSFSKTKHWILVICEGSSYDLPTNQYRTLDLVVGEGKIVMHDYSPTGKIDYLHVASYTGTYNDINLVIEKHPMNGTAYDPRWNNCQHYAATVVLLLQTIDCFSFNRRDGYDQVMDVLNINGGSCCHNPNLYFNWGNYGAVVAVTAALGPLPFVLGGLEFVMQRSTWDRKTRFEPEQCLGTSAAIRLREAYAAEANS